jgi:hypothetical protein
MRVNGHSAMKPLQDIKYHACPFGHKRAILVVDIQAETILELDDEGNRQYYCPMCLRIFSVDSSDKKKIGRS